MSDPVCLFNDVLHGALEESLKFVMDIVHVFLPKTDHGAVVDDYIREECIGFIVRTDSPLLVILIFTTLSSPL